MASSQVWAEESMDCLYEYGGNLSVGDQEGTSGRWFCAPWIWIPSVYRQLESYHFAQAEDDSKDACPPCKPLETVDMPLHSPVADGWVKLRRSFHTSRTLGVLQG